MAKIEILAPVGGREMLSAAVFSGADAVYLGFSGFNARSGADNFDAVSLGEAVSFCHARGVRVHVAVNTTVYGRELADVAAAARAVAQSGADAVICQDLAVARIFHEIVPSLPLHGSTQMSVHSLAGARQLAAMGFSRVILARELSLPEIAAITRGCGIETEVFVHGALCMSVSGQCYLSAFLGGRSGNRGSCAGPCRLPFDASPVPEGRAGRAHHLSLKDNSIIDRLDTLQAAGVASAKIEGRLRAPEYVAAAVSACVAAREGRAFDRGRLETVFSRAGFTSGYLDGKIDGTMFGMRTEADAEAARRALPALRELYRRERSSVPVHMELSIEPEGEKLTVTDAQGRRAAAYGDTVPQPAEKDPAEAYRRSLEKTGGTPFYAESVSVHADGDAFIPAGAVGELRREALDALLQKRSAPQPLPVTGWAVPEEPPRAVPARPALRARFAGWEQVPAEQLDCLECWTLPLAQAESVPPEYRARTILELPRVMFGALEEDTARRMAAAAPLGFAGFEAGNIAHFGLGAGLPLHGGMGLNVTNPLAAQEYAALGARSLLISPEVRDADMAGFAPRGAAGAVPVGALVYGHMPLMLTRACPLHNLHDCRGCPRSGELTDRKGRRFPVRCALGVRTVYNPVPIYMGDKPQALPVDFGVAWFSLESREQAAEVLRLLLAAEPFPGEFTRGLYFRGTV